MVGSCGRASGIIRVAGNFSSEFDSRPFYVRQRFIVENFGGNKLAEIFAKFFETNLAIFLLIFIKLSLFSLFFSHASTCSPLLTYNTRKEGSLRPRTTQISRSPKYPRASLGESLNVCILARTPLQLLQLTSINVCGGT